MGEDRSYGWSVNSTIASGGSGMGNFGRVTAQPQPLHGQPARVALTLPPLATVLLTDQPFDLNAPIPSISPGVTDHARHS